MKVSIYNLLLLTCLLSLSGCSDNTSEIEVDHIKPFTSDVQKKNWQYMVGTWYGKQPTKDGREREWVVKRNSNGTYKIIFNANGERQTEVGEWGISGGVYFSIFKGWLQGDRLIKADETSPYNRDAYDILLLTNEIFKYKHRSTGNEYTTKKVSDNIVFEKGNEKTTNNKSLKK